MTYDSLKEYVSLNSKLSAEQDVDPTTKSKLQLAECYMKIIKRVNKNFAGVRPIVWKETLNQIKDYLFEDEDEFIVKWKSYFKQYLSLKAKRWKLNEEKPASANQDTLICKICEKMFKAEKLPAHSKDCLDHAKELENFNKNQKDIIKLSESAVDLKQEITIKASIKR